MKITRQITLLYHWNGIIQKQLTQAEWFSHLGCLAYGRKNAFIAWFCWNILSALFFTVLHLCLISADFIEPIICHWRDCSGGFSPLNKALLMIFLDYDLLRSGQIILQSLNKLVFFVKSSIFHRSVGLL